jgi:dihydroorotate dehydrogenase
METTNTQTRVETQHNNLPKLSPRENLMLLRGTIDTKYFRERTRPMLYEKSKGDSETVHELVLDTLHRHGTVVKLMSPMFLPDPKLMIKVKGISVLPFGTAAGMDKNGDALEAFGGIFGFQEPGTVVISYRSGNPKVRVVAIEKENDLINAQGFPSKGIQNFEKNIKEYRESGGKAKLYVSICGLPSGEAPIKEASAQMINLIWSIGEYSNGLVWNPFSPNTASLKKLREPEVFKETASLMRAHTKNKLLLVKIGPYEPEERNVALKLVESFINGGGDGVVTTNTKMLPKDVLPESVKETWRYSSAGRSGEFLREYRLRSIRDIRRAFPDSVIIGTGGISDGEDAYQTFRAGANMVEGYTPYTYSGPGLVRHIMNGVSNKLEFLGFKSLEEIQKFTGGYLRNVDK